MGKPNPIPVPKIVTVTDSHPMAVPKIVTDTTEAVDRAMAWFLWRMPLTMLADFRKGKVTISVTCDENGKISLRADQEG